MSAADSPPGLTDELYDLLREEIYRYSGLRFDRQAKPTFEHRLQPRLAQCGCRNFRDYYLYLRCDPRRDDELAECVDLIAVHETYFFREMSQLTNFADELLPELIARRRSHRSLRIWSAGCSTGEEPYSLAMLLSERPELEGWEIEITATDISRRVLQHARQAVYRENSFRSADPAYVARFFRKTADGMQLRPAPRRLVTFIRLNLLDQARQRLIWEMDAIFCRNVLIYFDQEAKQRAADLFYEKLSPGGYLLLGHAESLLHMATPFLRRSMQQDLAYQKPLPALASRPGKR